MALLLVDTLTTAAAMPLPKISAASSQWSIADVERETGLGKDTLRVWERRYGFPNPTRDGQGDRLYDSQQLARLRLIKRLMERGFRPGRVVPLSMADLYALGPETDAMPLPQTRADAAVQAQGGEGAQWIEWLRNDQIDELRLHLRRHLLRNGLVDTIEQLITPLGVRVGEAWLAGHVSVYQEHLYTETVNTLMREALASMVVTDRERSRVPRVILSTLPRERHALGLLMVEAFLAMEGCDCRPLGPDTPVSEILQAAKAMQVDVVAVSISQHAAATEALHGLRLLREQLPSHVALWAGGKAAVLQTRRVPNGVSVMARAQDVVQAVAVWRAGQGTAASTGAFHHTT